MHIAHPVEPLSVVVGNLLKSEPLAVPSASTDLHDRLSAVGKLIDTLESFRRDAMLDLLRSLLPRAVRIAYETTWEYGDEGDMYRALDEVSVVDEQGRAWRFPTYEGEGFFDRDLQPEYGAHEDDEDLWLSTVLAPALGIPPERWDDAAGHVLDAYWSLSYPGELQLKAAEGTAHERI